MTAARPLCQPHHLPVTDLPALPRRRYTGPMSFVIEHQIGLTLAAFAAGILGAAWVYRSDRTSRWWRVADLAWVGLGGLGALAAILAGLYQDDDRRLARQIDVAYALARTFDADAARFRLAHCERDLQGPAVRPHVLALCGQVEFLSASAARNSDLPLFLDVVGTAAPLRSLSFLFGAPEGAMDAGGMEARAEAFDAEAFLSFAARTDETDAAIAALGTSAATAGIAAEYQVIAQSYEALIATMERLIADWRFLRDHSLVLALQVIAICLIALAAPFRLGKSVADLM